MTKSLSHKECEQILQNRFKTQEIKLIDYKLKPISEDAEGYMGEHYNLTITYKLNGKTLKDILFMKQRPTKKSLVEISNDTRVYEKEILFYDVLLPGFESNGYDTSFTAKSYFCIPNEAIIVENLLTKGYKLLERNQMFDMVKMKCVLKALALYHGAGFAYEKTKSAEMGKTYRLTDDFATILQERFFCQFVEHVPTSIKFWNGCNRTISSLIKVLPKDEAYKKEFLELFLNYPLSKVFADETKFAKTCGHGDLWSNNMMFKFDDGNTPTECCLVDFQLVRYFYPAFDVLLSIYGNTDAEFREKHLQEIYDYYYDTLAGVIKNYGHEINDIMTRDDFYKTVHLVKPECLLQVAFTDCVIFIPKEELSTVQKDEDYFETIMFNNSEIAVKLFKENSHFRKRITDILYEVHNALVAKTENIY